MVSHITRVVYVMMMHRTAPLVGKKRESTRNETKLYRLPAWIHGRTEIRPPAFENMRALKTYTYAVDVRLCF